MIIVHNAIIQLLEIMRIKKSILLECVLTILCKRTILALVKMTLK